MTGKLQKDQQEAIKKHENALRRGKLVEKRELVGRESTKSLPKSCDCAGATSYGLKPIFERKWGNADIKGADE